MFRSKTVPLVAALAAAAIVLAVAAVLIYGLANARQATEARAARLELENRGLRDQLARLSGGAASGGRGAAVPSGRPRAAGPAERPEGTAALEQARTIMDLREELAAASSRTENLGSRVRELEAAVQSAREESARMAASEAALRERVEFAARALEAAQAEARAGSERLARLEAANVRLREENRAAAAKAGQVPAWIKDLDDIERRREPLLAAILRRYKEVTDEYRALAGRLEDARDASPGAGQELGRIHNSISMAEEDLRQLTTLNSQAARLRQRIAAGK